MRKLGYILTVFFCIDSVIAQKVDVKLTPNEILIGEQSELSIKATYPSDMIVIMPGFNDEIQEKIEIVRMLKPDTLISEDKSEITLWHKYIVTCFDSGFYEIQPFQVAFTRGDDTLLVSHTDLFFVVNTVPVDTLLGFRDIKEPVELPFDWRELLPYFAIALIAILIILLFIYFWRKRKAKPENVEEVPEPAIPDFELALQKFDKIKSEKIWKTGKLKQYYIDISDVLREFIENRYKINAPELTSDEILMAIKTKLQQTGQYNNLRAILTLSDLAKFAKYTPGELENDKVIDDAIAFVKSHIKQNDNQEKEKSEG